MKEIVQGMVPDFVENFKDLDQWNVWGSEHEGYVDYDWGVIRSDQVTIEPDGLHVHMTKREAPRAFKGQPDRMRPYNTGWLDTKGIFGFERGAVEIVAKLPSAPVTSTGVWPAGWMRPDNPVTDGELDIFESFGDIGDNAETDTPKLEKVSGTVHFKYAGKVRSEGFSPWTPVPLSEDFHRFGMYASPEEVVFYLDGEEYHRVERRGREAEWDAAYPKGLKFHLRLCMQAGSKYYGQPNENTPDHAEMIVKSVRAWSFDK